MRRVFSSELRRSPSILHLPREQPSQLLSKDDLNVDLTESFCLQRLVVAVKQNKWSLWRLYGKHEANIFINIWLVSCKYNIIMFKTEHMPTPGQKRPRTDKQAHAITELSRVNKTSLNQNLIVRVKTCPLPGKDLEKCLCTFQTLLTPIC